MKTTIELHGYEIVIEDNEGVVTVTALKDEEVVEEFSLESEESQGDDEDGDVKGFGEFGDEEEDFDGDDEDFDGDDEGSEDEDSEEMPEEVEEEEVQESKLESFQSFISKKK